MGEDWADTVEEEVEEELEDVTMPPLCLLLEDGTELGDVLVRSDEESGAELLLSLLVVGCAGVVTVLVRVDVPFCVKLVSFLLVADACELDAVLVRVDDTGAELPLGFELLDSGGVDVTVVRVDDDACVELLTLLLVTATCELDGEVVRDDEVTGVALVSRELVVGFGKVDWLVVRDGEVTIVMLVVVVGFIELVCELEPLVLLWDAVLPPVLLGFDCEPLEELVLLPTTVAMDFEDDCDNEGLVAVDLVLGGRKLEREAVEDGFVSLGFEEACDEDDLDAGELVLVASELDREEEEAEEDGFPLVELLVAGGATEVVVCPGAATDVVVIAGTEAVDDAGASKGYFVPPTSIPRPLGKAMCCKPKRVVVDPYGMSTPWKPEVATTTSESVGSSYTVTVFPSVVMTTLRLKEVAFGGEVIVEVVAWEIGIELEPPEVAEAEVVTEPLDAVPDAEIVFEPPELAVAEVEAKILLVDTGPAEGI